MRYGLHSPYRCYGADSGEGEKARGEIGSHAQGIEGTNNAISSMRVFFGQGVSLRCYFRFVMALARCSAGGTMRKESITVSREAVVPQPLLLLARQALIHPALQARRLAVGDGRAAPSFINRRRPCRMPGRHFLKAEGGYEANFDYMYTARAVEVVTC
jgi:hypothetical protein